MASTVITPGTQANPAVSIQRVVVADFDMPIFSMVRVMVKWTIAGLIPAAVIGLCAWALIVGALLARQ
jgi:hypothetical protein